MTLDRCYTSRKALVYTRQSTQWQVLNNIGSQAHQRDQRQHAIRMGFAPIDAEVIDADLGESGTSTLRRQGYEGARARIRSGEIGAVFASDMSRLGRNAAELLSLLEDCKNFDVVIVLDGDPNDPNNPTQHFLNQMLAILADFDGARRTEMMSKARMAKARIGKAVSAPPTGYVANKDGTWELDPDSKVQESIRAVLRVFAEERSLAKTVRRLQQLEIVIWARQGAKLVCRKPVVANIVRILHNPAYMGEYRFPQRKVDRRIGATAKGHSRTRRSTPEEMVVIPDHHVGYITPEEWRENQRILELNAPTPQRRNLGSGAALLQGLVRCGVHRDRAMATRYGDSRPDGTSTHRYQCQGEYLEGGQECGCVPGCHLDRAAVTALFDRLSPPRLEMLKIMWEEAQRDARDEDRRRRLDHDRAKRRVDDLRSRLMSVDPNHRHVARIYETELNDAVRRLEVTERTASNEPSATAKFTEDTWEELLRLCRNLESIWNAETTTHQDRKQILRTMAKAVVVDERIKRQRRTERIRARVVWNDGHRDSVLDVKMLGYAYDLIAQWESTGCDAGEIAKRLNVEGLVTNQRNAWTRDTVAHALRSLRARRR